MDPADQSPANEGLLTVDAKLQGGLLTLKLSQQSLPEQSYYASFIYDTLPEDCKKWFETLHELCNYIRENSLALSIKGSNLDIAVCVGKSIVKHCLLPVQEEINQENITELISLKEKCIRLQLQVQTLKGQRELAYSLKKRFEDELLKKNTELAHFLSRCQCGASEGKMPNKLLAQSNPPQSSQLKESSIKIDLSVTSLSDHKRKLTKILKENEAQGVKVLKLNEKRVQVEGIKILISLNWANVCHLGLIQTNIGDEGVTLLTSIAWPLLQDLYLQKNALTILKWTASNIRGLKKLFIGDNYLTNLPAGIGIMTNLHQVSLSRNKFTELPLSLLELPSLQTLWAIGMNQIIYVKKTITFSTLIQRNVRIGFV